MHGLIQDIIHLVKLSENRVLTQEDTAAYAERYDEIVEKAEKEYEGNPPSEYSRMDITFT